MTQHLNYISSFACKGVATCLSTAARERLRIQKRAELELKEQAWEDKLDADVEAFKAKFNKN